MNWIRFRTVLQLVLPSAMAAGCLLRYETPVTPNLALVDVIELPTRLVRTGGAAMTAGENELVLLDAGEEEVPQGPQGFDVLEDGSFVIADPLGERLAFYDSAGVYLASCELGLAPQSVTRIGSQFEVRGLHTGAWYRARLLEGEEESECIVEEAPPETVGVRAAEEAGEAELVRDTVNFGTIDWTRGSRADRQPLEVSYQSDTTRMVSLQGVGPVTGVNRGFGDELMVVAIEAASPAETIRVRKEIQVYDETNRLVALVPDVGVDYFIAPETEFRIHGSKLYQLYPQRDGVRINVWSLEDDE
ncbi:MAG TPA: hypothetical protein VIL33_03770 [Rhodothermia bacterium]